MKLKTGKDFSRRVANMHEAQIERGELLGDAPRRARCIGHSEKMSDDTQMVLTVILR